MQKRVIWTSRRGRRGERKRNQKSSPLAPKDQNLFNNTKDLLPTSKEGGRGGISAAHTFTHASAAAKRRRRPSPLRNIARSGEEEEEECLRACVTHPRRSSFLLMTVRRSSSLEFTVEEEGHNVEGGLKGFPRRPPPPHFSGCIVRRRQCATYPRFSTRKKTAFLRITRREGASTIFCCVVYGIRPPLNM